MRFIHSLVVGALAATPLAAPASAQTASDSAVLKATQRVMAILGMPRRADDARRAGVPDSTIRGVIDILVKQKVPAEEAGTIFTATTESIAEHGPTDNFGAFVQAQLAAGKRGQELAAAIRAEHQRMGKGRPGNPGHRGGRPDAAAGKAPAASKAPAAGKKPDADTARGKRPGNPNAKHPN